MIQFIAWSHEEQLWHCWGSAVLGALQFPFARSDGWKKCSWHWSQLLSMLVQISQMWFLQKEKSMNTPFLFFMVPTCFVFPIFFQCLLQSSLVFCRILSLAHHPQFLTLIDTPRKGKPDIWAELQFSFDTYKDRWSANIIQDWALVQGKALNQFARCIKLFLSDFIGI